MIRRLIALTLAVPLFLNSTSSYGLNGLGTQRPCVICPAFYATGAVIQPIIAPWSPVFASSKIRAFRAVPRKQDPGPRYLQGIWNRIIVQYGYPIVTIIPLLTSQIPLFCGSGYDVTSPLLLMAGMIFPPGDLPLPSHWNASWPPPSREELAAGDKILQYLAGKVEREGWITDVDFIVMGRFADVSLPRLLRSIYFSHPDMAGALITAFGDGCHGSWATVLSPWNTPGEAPTLEPELVGAVISRGLSLYRKYTSPRPLGGNLILGAPFYEGKEFSVHFNLDGIAGEMGYLPLESSAGIVAHIEEGLLPLFIDAVIAFIEQRSYAWPKLTARARLVLQGIGEDSLKRIEGLLSPGARRYLANIDAIHGPSIPPPPHVKLPIARVAGRGIGKLITVAEATPSLSTLSHLPPDSVVAMEYLPTSDSRVGPFKGMLTFRQDGETSHAQKRAQFWDIPHALWPGAESLKALDQKYVLLEVSGDHVLLREATQDELIASRGGSKLARNKVDVPAANLQSPRYFLGRGDSLLQDPAHVGYKVASLNRWVRRPPHSKDPHIRVKLATGTALPFSAFLLALEASGVTSDYQRLLGELDGMDDRYVLDELKALLKNKMRIPSRIWHEMRHDATDWQAIRRGVFVRTSTNAEDLPAFPGFGAGIYKTVSNVKGESQLDNAILEAWGSAWSEEAFWERDKFGIDQRLVYPAVWFVPSVKGDYAFVIHTSNIALKRPDELTLEVVQGLGESIVGNDPIFAGFPARAVWNKRVGRVMEATFGTKSRQVILAEGGGTIVKETDPSKEFLNHADAMRLITALADIGQQAKTFFGKAQDIEGVLSADLHRKGHWTITLVQTRSIEREDRDPHNGSSPDRDNPGPTEKSPKNNLSRYLSNIALTFVLGGLLFPVNRPILAHVLAGRPFSTPHQAMLFDRPLFSAA